MKSKYPLVARFIARSIVRVVGGSFVKKKKKKKGGKSIVNNRLFRLKIAKVDVFGGEIGENRESVRERERKGIVARKNIHNFSVARVANLPRAGRGKEKGKFVLINTCFSK